MKALIAHGPGPLEDILDGVIAVSVETLGTALHPVGELVLMVGFDNAPIRIAPDKWDRCLLVKEEKE